ncbi:MAG: PAC2 family protein [archaeon]
MVTNINVISKKKLNKPIMIVGLPGKGLVGKICVDYLVKELKPKATLYAKLISDSFPPAVHAKNGILEVIYDEIYLYNGKNNDFLFLTGPVQPALANISNGFQHYEFAEKIADFCKEKEVCEIYTIAGLHVGDKRLNTAPKVLAVATDSKTKELLIKRKISSIYFNEDNTDTLISGAAGLLLGIANYNHNISGCCFMGETTQKLIFGDHGSARITVSVLCDLFKLKVNMTKINKEAKKIEESFNLISEKIQTLNNVKESPSVNPTYVR